MKKLLFVFMAVLLLLPSTVFAEQQVASWLTIGGDYQARYDRLTGNSAPYWTAVGALQAMGGSPTAAPVPGNSYKQDDLITNLMGLNFGVKPVKYINFKARLTMFNIAGSNSGNPVDQNMFFMDRAGTFADVLGHVPSGVGVNVDYAYFTWFNIADTPTWFSFGRRPSTNGIPGNLRRNEIHTGTGGTPNLLVNYVFDGFSLGWAPYIEALPGAYVKL